MQSSRPAQPSKLGCALLLILLPAIYFYYTLWKTSFSLPILDDYDIILGSLSQLVQHGGMFSFVFVNTHNGYKLIFENAIVLAQFSLFGKIHFLPLVILGNLFALPIFVTVLAMSSLPSDDLLKKAMLLIPVAYFVFQLQYASALNFASSSLQHLAVVSLSLLSIYFLSRNTQSSLVISCIFLVLAITASPNGFFVMPAGTLMLLQNKRWKQLVLWVVVTAAMLGLYMYRYAPPTDSGAQPGIPTVPPSFHLKLFYALSFLGSSAARYASVAPSVVLGLFFCGVFLLALRRRYFRQNPAVFYSILFIFLNAVAVSFIRSDSGVAQSLASRYRTYSNLLLAFSYLFLVENLLPEVKNRSVRRAVFAGCLLFSVAFCAVSDMAGGRFLQSKKEALTQSYIAQWQNRSAGGVSLSPELSSNPALARQIENGVYNVNVPVLQESVRLGVYDPPVFH